MTLLFGAYKRPNDSIPTGQVTARLLHESPLFLDGAAVSPGPVVADLDDTGNVALTVASTLDLQEGPAVYEVAESVGSLSRTWNLEVPDGTAIDIVAAYYAQ